MFAPGGHNIYRTVTARGSVVVVVAAIWATLGCGCVEPFRGSFLSATFASGVQVPGAPSDFGRPPANTHYSFLAIKHVTDASGQVTDTFVFNLVDFFIQPVFNRASPCFIEDDESRFPGLHVTKFAQKLREATGIDDPFDPPAGASDGDVIDVLTADVRMQNLDELQAAIKAVTTYSPAPYPDVDVDATGDPVCATDPAADPDKLPPPDCTDTASNEKRTRLCEQVWEAHPERYEGSDKVFTLPLNGSWLGAVDSNDPRNGQPISGAFFEIDAALARIDALYVNWQFNCAIDDFVANGNDCQPQYPAGFPDEDRSPIGIHYMSGSVEKRLRGVLNVSLVSRNFPQINGAVGIWIDVDEDNRHF